MFLGHRIDSLVHENNKPLQDIDLLQTKIDAYKPAYKQILKITQIKLEAAWSCFTGIRPAIEYDLLTIKQELIRN
jgi:hypothetical protein